MGEDKHTLHINQGKANYVNGITSTGQWIYIPAFQVSAPGLADLRTQEANAIQTKHMSACLRGKNGASNPTKEAYKLNVPFLDRLFKDKPLTPILKQ